MPWRVAKGPGCHACPGFHPWDLDGGRKTLTLLKLPHFHRGLMTSTHKHTLKTERTQDMSVGHLQHKPGDPNWILGTYLKGKKEYKLSLDLVCLLSPHVHMHNNKKIKNITQTLLMQPITIY